jgi:alpha-tubulin suppressor-like RCC1 family protein
MIRFIWIIPSLLFISACSQSVTPSTDQSTNDVPQVTHTYSNPTTGNIPGGGSGDAGNIGTPASLSIDPPNYDFQVQSVNSITNVTFTITNNGGQAATSLMGSGLSAPYSFFKGSYPGPNGTCTTSLAAGASCTIEVTFYPTSLGQFALSSFVISYNEGTLDVSLNGTATDIATLVLSNVTDQNSYYNFGTIAWGTTVTKDIHVYYYGARPATGVSFSGISGPMSITSNTCPQQVTSDCDVVITYTGNVTGATSETLEVTYDNSSYAAASTHVMTGNTSAQVTPATLTMANANFGTDLIGSTVNQTIQVIKGGTLPATGISAILSSGAFSFAGGAGFPGTGGSCTSTITANCTLVVSFSPTAQTSYSNVLTLSFNNGQNQGSGTSQLSGVGANAAVLTLTPTTNPANFGSAPVGYTNSLSFTLTNSSGSVSATSIAISIPTGAFSYAGGCGTSLTPGGYCNFTVRFKPSSAISFSNTMQVGYFDGSQNQTGLQLGLVGQGTAGASLVASVTSYNFGSVVVGSTATATLTLNYYGSDPATVISTTGIAPPFGYPGGNFSGGGTCGSTISANCTVIFSFSPTAVGSFSTTFALTYSNGDGSQSSLSIALSGTGIQYTAAVLAFSQSPSVNFGNIPVGTSSSMTLTVTRTGNLNASSVAASGFSGDFSFKGSAYPGTGGTCGTTISASSCTLVVNFAPSVASAESQTLTLSYYNGFSNQQISILIQGTGINVAILNASTGVFAPTPFQTPENLVITITNTGTRQTDSLALNGALASPFTLVSNGCPAQLMPSSNCAIEVNFAPVAPGAYSKSFSLNYQNGVSSQVLNVALSASGTVPVLISVNGNFSCGRNNVGQLKCWGQNNYGQLGQGDTVDRGDGVIPMSSLQPISLGTNRYAVAIASGFWHACAILDNGSLKCWGGNTYGQLGLGTSSAAVGNSPNEMGDNLATVNLGTGLTAVSVVAGYDHTCVILNDHGIKCWGENDSGQLGLGNTNTVGLLPTDMGNNLPEVNVNGLQAVQITASTSHTCALLSDSSLRCWGDNFFGQLGLGNFTDVGGNPSDMGANLQAVNLGTGLTATAVSAGGAFTCAILNTASVKCWGRNEDGILGEMWAQDANGDVGPATNSTDYPLPLRGYGIGPNQMGDAMPTVSLGTGRTVLALSTADSSTCALLDDSTVKCWGENQDGQLGQGDAVDRGVTGTDMGDNLLAVNFGSNITPVSFSSGNFHDCALFNTGAVKCWGYNLYGNLGIGNTTNMGDAADQMGSYLPFVSF